MSENKNEVEFMSVGDTVVDAFIKLKEVMIVIVRF